MISLVVVLGTWVEVGEKKMKNIKYDADHGSPASHSRNHQPLLESPSTSTSPPSWRTQARSTAKASHAWSFAYLFLV